MKFTLKIFAFLLALCALLSSFAGCNGNGEVTTEPIPLCTQHTDTDSNGICDVCGAELGKICKHVDTDGDNLCDLCEVIMVVPIGYTVILADKDKNPVADASVKLYAEGELAAEGKTNAEGKFAGELLPGSYVVMIEGLADGWFVESNGLTVTLSAESNSFEFTAASSAADGSEETPFYIGTEPLEIDFEANKTLHFYTRGSEKHLVINNANVKVTYAGKDYLPEGGKIRILLAAADSNSTTPFAVTCTAPEKVTLELEAIPGSLEAPFELTVSQKTSAEVKKDGTTYYSMIAQADGFLVLESSTADNNIMMYNKTAYVVTGYTKGGRSVVIKVKKGDDISIAVASNLSIESTTVEFTVTLHAGTAADPMPVYAGTVVRLAANESVTLVYHGEAKKLSIPANGLKAAVGGTDLTASADVYTADVTEGSIITLINTSAGNLDVELTVN